MTTLVWFRPDLRLADNPALVRRRRGGRSPSLPVYIHAPTRKAPGSPAARRAGGCITALMQLAAEFGALGLAALRTARARTRSPSCRAGRANARRRASSGIAATSRRSWRAIEIIKRTLQAQGIEAESYRRRAAARALVGPHPRRRPFSGVHALLAPLQIARRPGRAAAGAARHCARPRGWPASQTIDELGLLPRIDWAGGPAQRPGHPGERGSACAGSSVSRSEALEDYPSRRDEPGRRRHLATVAAPAFRRDRSAPDLARGAARCAGTGPALHLARLAIPGRNRLARVRLSPALSLSAHARAAAAREFARFPWQSSRALLRAWQRGATGYPIVDAGMRELWHTGWMHNRVRMIAASFLVKDLLLPWTEGARWFWDTLVDADLASNTLGWQWVAGCGADAAPFFRVFNPVTQGDAIRSEPALMCAAGFRSLRRLPDRWIHEPWAAPADGAARRRRCPGCRLSRSRWSITRRRADGRYRRSRVFAAEHRIRCGGRRLEMGRLPVYGCTVYVQF